MKRNIDINEITDGQHYNRDSLVKISCNDCKGCEKCCHDMGDSIILDPYDIYNMTMATGKTFEQLLNKEIALSVVDGIIFPHINMVTDNIEAPVAEGDNLYCSFLINGRCTIHNYRPGFCRLFPLGRLYNEDGSFDYINQIYECDYPIKSKIKVKKWLGIMDIGQYEKYVVSWHELIKNLQERMGSNDELLKKYNMALLNLFFVTAYEKDDFYKQYYARKQTFENC